MALSRVTEVGRAQTVQESPQASPQPAADQMPTWEEMQQGMLKAGSWDAVANDFERRAHRWGCSSCWLVLRAESLATDMVQR